MSVLLRYFRYLIVHQLPGFAGLLVSTFGAVLLYFFSIIRLELVSIPVLGIIVFLGASSFQFRSYSRQQEIGFLKELRTLGDGFEDHSVMVKAEGDDVKISRLLTDLRSDKLGDDVLAYRRAAIDIAEDLVRAWHGMWKENVRYLLEHPSALTLRNLHQLIFNFWFMLSLHYNYVIEKGIKLVNETGKSQNRARTLSRFNNYKTHYNSFAIDCTKFFRRFSSVVSLGVGTQVARTIDTELELEP